FIYWYFFLGLLYPFCSTPLSRSPRCEFSQSSSAADGSMLPRGNRPRELRITPPSSSLMMRTTDNVGNNTSKHPTGVYSTSFRVHGISGGTTPANGPSTSVVVDEMVPMNSTTNSRKVK
uniref:Secreted protein n=1 Tax=Elaeophora elaphi TaxID=1147741 RepID=A0A0R3S494_9BILA